MINKLNIPKPVVDLTFHTIPEGKSNYQEFTLDSFGSVSRTLTESGARVRIDVLGMKMEREFKKIKEPEKTLYIETIYICDGAYCKVYNIQPDGTHVYNEMLSKYILNNAHNPWLLHRIFKQAIIA